MERSGSAWTSRLASSLNAQNRVRGAVTRLCAVTAALHKTAESDSCLQVSPFLGVVNCFYVIGSSRVLLAGTAQPHVEPTE